MFAIENVKNINRNSFPELKSCDIKRTIELENKPDTFEKKKIDKSANGKFDVSECIKNFAKGVLSPITAVVKHPLITAGTVAVTAAACTLVPVLGPIMAVGFGTLSVFQLGKGVVNVVKYCKNGEYDNAEKSFNEVGQGTVGVAMGVAGIKQSAKVAKEAKLMSELGTTSLDSTQKAQIAQEVKNGTRLDALKEVGSLFTAKSGLKAVGKQFKPNNIAARGKEALKFLFNKEKVTKVKKEKMPFSETTEGKRRAAMTTEEIEVEVKALYKEACDEYGISEELRPKIEVYSDPTNIETGGGYSSNQHKITINADAYKAGHFDLPDVIKHETTHAGEAILRQSLPQEEKEKILVEYLLDKINNGDKKEVLTGEKDLFIGMEKIETPKMNSQMKADFSKLAQDKLYNLSKYTDDDYVKMVKPLVESNPDFIQQYGSTDEAITALSKYAQNHHFRYDLGINNSSGFNTSNIDTSLLRELTPEEKIAAIKSFKEGIDCLESNVCGQGFLGDFEQYQFTPEEVLCQQKGNNFEIKNLNKQLENLRSKPNYDLAEEARLLDQIKKSELTIEYKTLGEEMYKLKIESINNPENTELASKVEMMKEQLTSLNNQIETIQGELTMCERTSLYLSGKLIDSANYGYNYSTCQVNVRPEMGASHNIPISTTNAADIIADNIEKK